MKRKDIYQLRIDEVEVEEGFNPRVDYGDMDSLIESIRENGVKVPLRGFRNKDGKFVLTDGHRRFRAINEVAKLVPEIEFPFLIDTSNKSLEQRIIDVMVCNDGLKLNPLEESTVVGRLLNYGMSEKDICIKTGKSSVYISNLKLLQSAPQRIKNLIIDDVVSSTLALKVLREEPDYITAIKTLEAAVDYTKSKGKSKVVLKDVENIKGKVNSYAAVKKCFKYADKNELQVNPERLELYSFLRKVINGEVTEEELNEIFFQN